MTGARAEKLLVAIFTFAKIQHALSLGRQNSYITLPYNRRTSETEKQVSIKMKMKVKGQNYRRCDQVIIPPISFKCLSMQKPEKSEHLIFKLRSNPVAADSGMYEVSVAYFGTRTSE